MGRVPVRERSVDQPLGLCTTARPSPGTVPSMGLAPPVGARELRVGRA